MRNLVGKKNKGTKLWWHGTRRGKPAGRERREERKNCCPILARRSRRVSLGDVTAHGRVQD